MPASYSVILCDMYGRYVAQLAPRKMSLSQVANGVGELKLELPGWFDRRLAGPYQFIDVWRRPVGGPRQLWRYVTLAHPMAQGDKGTTFYSLQASSLNVILDFRVRDNPNTDETQPADTLLTSWVNRCLSYEDTFSGFAGSNLAWRDLTRWFAGWSVVKSTASGPSVLAKAGSGSLLQFCQDVVKLAAQAGEPWFFDIVPTGSDLNFGMRFTLYRYQRGVDLTGLDPQRGSALTLTMSREAGGLSKLEYNVDYSSEVNFVWRLTGTGAALRDARVRSGYLRYPLGRREVYGGPDADLDAILRAGLPQRVVRAEIVDTAQHRFGVQWGWGDKVMVRLESGSRRSAHDVMVVPMRADSVTIDVDETGRETVRAALNLVV
jgi:hypothetical protein